MKFTGAEGPGRSNKKAKDQRGRVVGGIETDGDENKCPAHKTKPAHFWRRQQAPPWWAPLWMRQKASANGIYACNV